MVDISKDIYFTNSSSGKRIVKCFTPNHIIILGKTNNNYLYLNVDGEFLGEYQDDDDVYRTFDNLVITGSLSRSKIESYLSHTRYIASPYDIPVSLRKVENYDLYLSILSHNPDKLITITKPHQTYKEPHSKPCYTYKNFIGYQHNIIKEDELYYYIDNNYMIIDQENQLTTLTYRYPINQYK